MSDFKVGQTVVHLSYGLGKIVGLETREFKVNDKSEFFILEIQDNECAKKVFVDVKFANTRLRKLIDSKQAKEILDYINSKPDPAIDHQTWNRRYREYMERIHTGDAMEIAKVYVALRVLAHDKDLSFGERKLLDQCRTLLENELSAVGLTLPY